LDDVDIRFKWAGLFHRAKRTPKKFMMRIKVRMHAMCMSACMRQPVSQALHMIRRFLVHIMQLANVAWLSRMERESCS